METESEAKSATTGELLPLSHDSVQITIAARFVNPALLRRPTMSRSVPGFVLEPREAAAAPVGRLRPAQRKPAKGWRVSKATNFGKNRS
jgi:hypothetical protein